jgi:hypothetical protein
MADFGEVAKKAYDFCKEGVCPVEAWYEAGKKEGLTQKNQEKGCPRCTFLGLCQEGLLKGISSGSYTRSKKNKAYGLAAVRVLAQNDSLKYSPETLWEAIRAEVPNRCGTHNHQMDVVRALWKAGYIEKGEE